MSSKDFKGLWALKDEELLRYYIIVYPGPDERSTEEWIPLVPYNIFL